MGVTAALVLIGVAAITFAFLVASYAASTARDHSGWPFLIGALASLSVIGLGMVVASFTRTVSQAFMVANFPMAMMMFFSGVIYPDAQGDHLFTIGTRQIGLYDILPPTHAVVALNKVLTLGAGLSEVLYELSMLTVLSALYFAIGVWLFKRYHLRSG